MNAEILQAACDDFAAYITEKGREFALSQGRPLNISRRQWEKRNANDDTAYWRKARERAQRYFAVAFHDDDVGQLFSSHPLIDEVVEAMRPMLEVNNEEVSARSLAQHILLILDLTKAPSDNLLPAALFPHVSHGDVESIISRLVGILRDVTSYVGDGFVAKFRSRAEVLAFQALRWKDEDIWAHPDPYLTRYPNEQEAFAAWAKANGYKSSGPFTFRETNVEEFIAFHAKRRSIFTNG